MKIAVTGGTGFIGSKLTSALTKEGHSVYILTRNPDNKPEQPSVTYIKWLSEGAKPEKELEGIDAIVNLAGESIGEGRWTEERKKKIKSSRIDATKEVISILEKLDKKPDVLVNASATGYYGNSLTETFTEESSPVERNFLSDVVIEWEKEAIKAQELGIRTVFTRFGIVLSKEEGALNRMLLPYKLFAGGPLGSGKQWFSWVHIDDVVGLILFSLKQKAAEGPINVTSPHPLQMNDFGKVVGDVLGRPHWLPAPSFALKMALGEMSTLVLDGQKVLPVKAEKLGYTYHFRDLKPALCDLLK
ncbi:TIGR01777 family oxidoreductase [Alkalihalophilus marmarensis]|uniref:TIGR01777 family oxidoreductase n=1 Tax=Alkalihalophilus marmarensis TaxID=521377 RepID=UPI002E20F379|nr:TIGR01777 family oxidoreductase [Alkalihalophilus marmarensis]